MLDDSIMRRSDALKTMLGFARTIVADGELSDGEIDAFDTWIEANPEVRGVPAVDEIVGVLANVTQGGTVSDEQRAQLLEVIERFSG